MIYRCLDTQLWNDEFLAKLSATEKLIYIHLLTNEYTNMIGLYKASIAALADDLGMDLKGYRKGFERVTHTLPVGYQKGIERVYVGDFIHHNRPPNPNVIRGWKKLFDAVPNSCVFKGEWLDKTEKVIESYGVTNGKTSLLDAFRSTFPETLREPFRNPSGTLPETETETESETESVNRISKQKTGTGERERLKPPRAKGSQVSADYKPSEKLLSWFRSQDQYKKISPEVETEKFVDYYLGTGKVLKDWDAAWRNWIRRAIEIKLDKGFGRFKDREQIKKENWEVTKNSFLSDDCDQDVIDINPEQKELAG